MTVLGIARCAWCHRPADEHSIDDARRCVDELQYRESNYCRLTGPKRVDDSAFYTQLGAATLPRIADLAIARSLGQSDAARGERRVRVNDPSPSTCDDVV
jgi:hypothetical protein